MTPAYELLVEKEEMWAKMLIQVLKDNNIPCVSIPVLGAGFVARTGIQERLKVHVPSDRIDEAKEILDELFPENS